MKRDRVVLTWKLASVPAAELEFKTADPILAEWADLAERERLAGIRPGQWFLLPAGGVPDPDVIAFFRFSKINAKSKETRRSYAHDLKVHLEFLGHKGTSWRAARPSDLDDYEFWRRRDPRNPNRISDSKFNRELAACRLFYDYQTQRGAIARSPLLLQEYRRRDGSTGVTPELRAKARASNDVKWLTPAAYRKWRRVGLAGYEPSDMPQENWRGRNDGRNLAFAELLWSSGLRLREAATLLVPELPRAVDSRRYYRGKLARSVAKGNHARHYWVSSQALAMIDGYAISTRQAVIDRARAEGRYEAVPGRILVTSLVGRSGVRIRTDRGREGRATFAQLDEDERRLLFRETPEGLEPLALWLGDSGLPMRTSSWEAVFAAANQRMTAFGIGTPAGPLHCRPHMLRHSFALRMLVTLQHVFDQRLGLTPEERKEYRLLFGDPWVLVAQLLGHRSIDTTRNIYLEPARGLQLESLLNEGPEDADDITALLSRLAEETLLVHDITDAGAQSPEDRDG